MAGNETVIEAASTETQISVADLTPARVDHGALVTAAAPTGQIVAAFAEYQDLTGKLLTADDYQSIQGKSFKKKSAYRKLSVAFGVSFEIVDRVHDRDEDGRIVRSEFTVRAVAPNGRFMDGYGACSVFDRCTNHYPNCQPGCTRHCGGRVGGCDGFNHFSKPEHDVPATAETRAKNRAASDLFGMGEVSAEEVDERDPATRKATSGAIDDLMQLAKSVKAKGIDVGKAPTLLGVELYAVTTEADGQMYRTTLVTGAQVAELTTKLENMVSPPAGESGDDKPAGEPPAAPSGGGNGAASKPEARSEPKEAPATEPVADSPAPLPDDDTPSESSGDNAGDGADPALFPSPAPAPAPPLAPVPTDVGVLSTAGERARFASLLKAAFPKGDDGDAARAALSSYLSDGRATSSKEITGVEIRMGIKAAKLLGEGHLQFAVDDGESLIPAGAGVVPPAENAALIASCPEGGDAAAGIAFIKSLVAMWDTTPAEVG